MFYAKSTNGFYIPEIHGDNIPADAVEITMERHRELMEGQEEGLQISGGDDGFPILIEHAEGEAPYTILRAAEYPPMADYLDGVVKGDQAQIDAYIAACQAVKAKYPKP